MMTKIFVFLFCLFYPVGNPLFAQISKDSIITVSIYFKSGSYKIDSEQKDSLIRLYFSKDCKLQQISGFTDTVGTLSENRRLAQQRILSVLDILKVRFEFNSKDFEIRNFGEENPKSRSNIALNRRVDIEYEVIENDSDSKPSTQYTIVGKLDLGKIYFKPDKAELEPFSLFALEDVIQELKENDGKRYEIRGHVNWNSQEAARGNSGYAQQMMKLSEDRARLIYEILIEKGVPASRLSWRGMGNSEMIFPHANSDEEKRKNMRVEIIVFKRNNLK